MRIWIEIGAQARGSRKHEGWQPACAENCPHRDTRTPMDIALGVPADGVPIIEPADLGLGKKRRMW